MKPQSSTTTNPHLSGSGERNGEQRRTKVSFGRTLIWALELQWLAKRHISGQNDVEQWRNQAYSFSGYQVKGIIQSVSQSVSQSDSQSDSQSVR